jgi:hypothetical protein
MNEPHSIIVEGFTQPNVFVEIWSKYYTYSNEYKYDDNITHVLEDWTSFLELFRWKNGTGDTIYTEKLKVVEGFYNKVDVLKDLQVNFSWEVFESEFEPTKSSPIWKIFLLHLINPNLFPIYDQHVFRFYSFVKTGGISEIPVNKKELFDGYKNDYTEWFNQLQNEFKLSPRKMDKSFVVYGQVLKFLKKIPVEIVKV